MHLRCPYCGLTLQATFFEMAEGYQSLCHFCRQRSLRAADFYNGDAYYLAQALKRPYTGQTAIQEQPNLALSRHQKKLLTSLIQSYQTSPAALKQAVSLLAFSKQVLAIEDGARDFETTGDFVRDLTQLGFELGGVFHQNHLDYTTRQLIREKYHYTCQYCGRYGTSVDHKDPVFISQDNRLHNLTLACSECNRLKGDMPYQQFMALNQQVTALNQQLVQFEKLQQHLQQLIDANRQQLAAQQHLSNDPKDPALAQFRQKAKTLQFVYDSGQSDYQKLIDLKHDFVVTQAKVADL